MAASEKQTNFIKSLYQQVAGMAPELTEEQNDEVGEKLEDQIPLITKVMKDEEVDFKKASDLISLLLSIKETYQPKSASIRWKKIGDKFLISGPSDLLIEGEEVEVTSQKGKKMVTVGRIYSESNGTTLAHPAKKNKNIPAYGFYFHKNDLDKIIQVYKTKNGWPASREIVYDPITEDTTRTYLGQSGFSLIGEKLTTEQIKDWGQETVFCLCCGKRLTLRESKERGIGPTCWAKMLSGEFG